MGIKASINIVRYSIVNRICNILFMKVQRNKDLPFIAMFHNIVGDKCEIIDNYTCTEQEYDRFINILLEKGFDIISLDELLDISDKSLFNNKVVITFDDGFSSTYTYVHKYMLERQLPYIVYVNTSFVGQRGYLNENQIKEMSINPLCTIGMHANEHIPFRGISNKKLQKDFKLCNDLLVNITGEEPKHYAFPYGSVNSCSIKNCKVIKNQGVKSIAMTLPIKLTMLAIKKPFYLPRVNIPSYFARRKNDD